MASRWDLFIFTHLSLWNHSVCAKPHSTDGRDR
jgi:hypothetical protein